MSTRMPVGVRVAVALRIAGAARAMVTDPVGGGVGPASTSSTSNVARNSIVPATVPDWNPIWAASPNIAVVELAGTVNAVVLPPVANWMAGSSPPSALGLNDSVSRPLTSTG